MNVKGESVSVEDCSEKKGRFGFRGPAVEGARKASPTIKGEEMWEKHTVFRI